MKKMSEVFELPAKNVYGSAYAHISRVEVTRCASHAINHVDSLSDALKEMIDACCDESLSSSASEIRLRSLAALAAYRGEA